MSFWSKFFAANEPSEDTDQLTRLEELERKTLYQLNQLKAKNEEISNLQQQLRKATQDSTNNALEAEKFQRELEKLKKKDSVKLSDAQAKKQLSSLQKAKLKSLEEQLKSAPESIQGGSMVYDKKTKKTSFVQFKSKTEALALIDKAKKGKIQIVS